MTTHRKHEDSRDPDCAKREADLSALVDGELDETDAKRVHAHLETCPGCRAFVEDVRRLVGLHQEARVGAPADVLNLDIEVPEGTPDSVIADRAKQLALCLDELHRSKGGHGLKVDGVEVYDASRVLA